ncbi:hypothetical protein EXU48_02085 [Occultella glacieicola]|uniref:Uncharacterized protein n=1 Tax=Occultella glacieicola TaxID=2518684 RepID=A0ABY2EB47_9MICO|nr:hypothetical protein [Occultella glacieicola]TDE98998.1 hypothetical protein EXU48_02085 [Occultella glacieicola]
MDYAKFRRRMDEIGARLETLELSEQAGPEQEDEAKQLWGEIMTLANQHSQAEIDAAAAAFQAELPGAAPTLDAAEDVGQATLPPEEAHEMLRRAALRSAGTEERPGGD